MLDSPPISASSERNVPRVVDDPSRQDPVAGLVDDRDVRALAMQIDTDRIHPWVSSHPDLNVRLGE